MLKGSSERNAACDAAHITATIVFSMSGSPANVAKLDVIFCHGVYGSASTWVYNVTRELANLRNTYSAFYSDDCQAVAQQSDSAADGIIIKTHLPDVTMRLLLRLRGTRCILTVRNPFDAVVSMMERFELTFFEASKMVVASCNSALHTYKNQPTLVLRYEDNGKLDANSVKKIAHFLSFSASREEIEDIAMRYDAAALKTKLIALEASGTFSHWTQYDPVTNLHPRHLGSGLSGKYRSKLDEVKCQSIANSISEYFAVFRYPLK